MSNLEVKSFSSPDETRPFHGKGKVEVLSFDGRDVMRGYYEPGWKWSDNLKPIAHTDTCQVTHFGYCVSGTIKVFMDDGQEAMIGPGDVFSIPPGHDAEVVGEQPCVTVDFGSLEQYAKI